MFTQPLAPGDNAPDVGAFPAAGNDPTGSDARVQQTVPGAFITSGGNIYSFSSASNWLTSVPGTGGPIGGNTYFVAQMTTLGNTIAPSSVKLILDPDGEAEVVFPDSDPIFTINEQLSGGFGGTAQTGVYTWTLPRQSPPEFLLDFTAGASSTSLDQLVIDVFTSAPTLAGDYDGNGFVDVADYQVWTSQYGTSATEADGNFDGTIDVLDYTLWRDNLGAGVAPTITTGGALAVPEPSSL
ncbi:MAG: hypothetical protein AAGF31_07170, partial [Planctomycetota bacterium]